MKKALIIIFIVLIIDQLSKFWVKTNMFIGESIPFLGKQGQIYFIENEGMAFGMELGGADFSKLLLSVIRIIVAGALGVWIYRLTQKPETKKGLIVALSLIMAGAIGNIIDSAFYGLIFSESVPGVPIPAQFMPADGGYTTFLHGKVVDMLYFPLFTVDIPQGFPLMGGEKFTFFNAIFNVADSAVTIGAFMLILFQNRYFPKEEKKEVVETPTVEDTTSK